MSAPHIPVLLDEVIAALAPRPGEVFVDGTFGAGGYSRAILAKGANVIGIDRDPSAIAAGRAQGLQGLTLVEGRFGDMDELAGVEGVDGVALDIGVSSMQIDQAARGFSFRHDGPLDMRMSSSGESAADRVNQAPERLLADAILQFGEERRSRAIARAIAEARARKPIETTADLVAVIESVMGKGRPGDIHPATRTFQGLRIWINGELTELARGLAAAERLLKPHGRLAVVTFHSLEDRIVKRFMQERCGRAAGPSRHLPEMKAQAPTFELLFKGAIEAGPVELAANPRARSARLRAVRRTSAPARPFSWGDFALPPLAMETEA